ncbi:MAG: ABC transporter substrate-binding protein [Burkholderiaceae bacterium]|nr:ABC transporter substrate-binding protein [Burkholderiaceae bacterium]
MNRREYLCGLTVGMVSAPFAAQAQQAAMPVIGVLHGVSAKRWTDRMVGFHRGLAEAGVAEGRNVSIEYRWAEDHFDRLPAMAADLVSRRVRVISTGAPDVAIRSAMGATNTIPIVFMTASDPVRAGFVSNLGCPEGNVTGVTLIAAELSAKRMELLHEIAPTATRVALLVNPNNPGLMQDNIQQLSAALHSLGLEMLVVKAGSESGIENAFATAVQQRAQAMHIGADAYLSSRSPQISSLALRHGLPTSSESREGVAAGLLMSYGQSHSEVFRQLGLYVGRIVNGAKPAELPVLQPTKLELVINLKISRALGLPLPRPLLLRADEIIE